MKQGGAGYLDHVLGHVIAAHPDRTSGGGKLERGGGGAPTGGDGRIVGDGDAMLSEQRDFGVVHVAAVGYEKVVAEKIVGEEVLRRAHAARSHYRLYFLMALGQVDGGAEAVSLGQLAGGAQQVGRAQFGRVRGYEASDAPILASVPRRDEVFAAAESGLELGGREVESAFAEAFVVGVVEVFCEEQAQAGVGEALGVLGYAI